MSAPDTDRTRPMLDRQRESLFNVLRHDLPCEGVLDIFAGSGALGFEALSRGAERATFVERGREALSALRANAAALRFEDQSEILRTDALALDPARLTGRYSLVFLDPPFPLWQDKPARILQLIARLTEHESASEDLTVMLRVPIGTGPATEDWPTGLRVFDERSWGESELFLLTRTSAASDSEDGEAEDEDTTS